jgi:anti-sigma-K factor RskA
MTDGEDIDGLAAEYVLGSLEPSERKAVNERRKHETALNEAIAAWESRLAPLNDDLPGVAPPADLSDEVLSRVRTATRRGTALSPVQRRKDWRSALLAGTVALAACLLLALGIVRYLGTQDPDLLVAQLHRTNDQGTGDEAHLPAFAVAVDRKGTLSVRPILVRPVLGKSFALWLMPHAGATPIFLGIVSPSTPTTLPWSASRPLREYVNSGLMITLEPEVVSGTQLPVGHAAFSGTLLRIDG